MLSNRPEIYSAGQKTNSVWPAWSHIYNPVWSKIVPFGPVGCYGLVSSHMVLYGLVWARLVLFKPAYFLRAM